MILYRYLGSHAFESLRNCELMTSRIGKLNDPLEFKYRVTGTMTDRKCLALICRFSKKPKSYWESRPSQLEVERSKVRKHHQSFAEAAKPENLERGYRVVCFSSSTVTKRNEILLWSHYANKHRGVRIGFTFPANLRDPIRLYKVKYRKQRLPLDATKGADGIAQIEKVFRECQYRKSTAWSYESEHRGIAHLSAAQSPEKRRVEGRKLFVKIEPGWVQSVDFGLNCPAKEKARIIDLLRRCYPHVKCREAKPHKSAYALTFTPV